jgi:YD repeat-containing protein
MRGWNGFENGQVFFRDFALTTLLALLWLFAGGLILAGPARAGELLTDTQFTNGLEHWRTPAELSEWNPFSTGVADLDPDDDYRGLLFWQALNVPDPGGEIFSFSVDMFRVEAEMGSAVSFAIEYMNTDDVLERARLLPVSNTMAPEGSWISLTREWRCPDNTKRLTRFLVQRDDAGHLRMRRPSLTHALLENSLLPTITSLEPTSGPYKSPVTIKGKNFGEAKGRVQFTKTGLITDMVDEDVWVEEWSDDSITITPYEPDSGGELTIFTAEGVSSMERTSFELESDLFTVHNLTSRPSAFQGQPLEMNFELRLSDGNPGYGEEGILLVMRGSTVDAEGLYTIEPETVHPDAENPVAAFKAVLDTDAIPPASYVNTNRWWVQTIETDSFARRCPVEFDIAARGGGTRYGVRAFDAGGALDGAMGLPQPRVDLATLDLLLESTLFRMKTNGPPVRIGLMFTGRAADQLGVFGKGWRMSHESRIDIAEIDENKNDAKVITTKGETLRFSTWRDLSGATEEDPVVLTSPPGNYDTLTCYGTWFEYVEKSTKLRFRYEKTGLASETAWLTRITDRNDRRLTLDTDTTTGQVRSITDEANRAFTFAYNGDGLCNRIQAPDGRDYEMIYQQGRITSITDPEGYQASYAYDGAGFLTTVSMSNKQIRYTYETRPGAEDDKYVHIMAGPDGRQTSYAFREGRSDVTRVTDSRGNTREIATQAGRPTMSIAPGGELNQIGYENNLPAIMMDENGNTTSMAYDANGNVVEVIDAQGGKTKLEYDEHDNLIRHENALGHVWEYRYDAVSNLTEVISPLNKRTIIQRDTQGRIQTVTNAENKTTRYGYDT